MTNLNTIAEAFNLPYDIVEDLAFKYFDLYGTADGFIEDLELSIEETKPHNIYSSRDMFIINYRKNKKYYKN